MTKTSARLAGLVFGLSLLSSITAPLSAATIKEYTIAGGAAITTGPDGAVWLTLESGGAVGRMTPAGSYRLVNLPTDGLPLDQLNLFDITLGSDGRLWITATGRNEIFSLAADGTATEYPLPVPKIYPGTISTGPDGNIWFVTATAIGRLKPSGQTALFPATVGPVLNGGITSGPDGNLWFCGGEADTIGRMTPGGQLTVFHLPNAGSGPLEITRGGGDLWFTEFLGNRIGRISTTGAITEYQLPQPDSHPVGIVEGPDGNMWFMEAGRIGRITAQGALTELDLSGPPHELGHLLTVGPDGNLWFTKSGPSSIGRFTIGGTPGPCVPGDTVLCIDDLPGDQRFKVEVEYSTTQGGGFSGNGHAIPLASLGVNRGGLFWFFNQDNPEILVKILDGCSDNGKRWVFVSGGTNVGLVITVRDTVTDEVHSYYNLDRKAFAPVQDTLALACGG